MSCVPLSSFFIAFFSSWIRANSGLISLAAVSDKRASQEVSFVRGLAGSKGASPYSSASEDFWSLM
jgi:hypothetical protein